VRQLKHCPTCETLVLRDVDAAKCILFASISIWLTGERPYNMDWVRPAPQSARAAPFQLGTEKF
jgi:hypothetical protein